MEVCRENLAHILDEEETDSISNDAYEDGEITDPVPNDASKVTKDVVRLVIPFQLFTSNLNTYFENK